MTFYIYKDDREKWHWHLKDSKDNYVASSAEDFYCKRDALHSIGRLKQTCFRDVEIIEI